MTTKSSGGLMQKEIMKWALVAVLGLAAVGAASIRDRDVYSKEQVDDKDAAVSTEVEHVKEMHRVQNDHTNEQLQFIRDDVGEIKALLRDNN